jgi:hypothetical protein
MAMKNIMYSLNYFKKKTIKDTVLESMTTSLWTITIRGKLTKGYSVPIENAGMHAQPQAGVAFKRRTEQLGTALPDSHPQA